MKFCLGFPNTYMIFFIHLCLICVQIFFTWLCINSGMRQQRLIFLWKYKYEIGDSPISATEYCNIPVVILSDKLEPWQHR